MFQLPPFLKRYIVSTLNSSSGPLGQAVYAAVRASVMPHSPALAHRKAVTYLDREWHFRLAGRHASSKAASGWVMRLSQILEFDASVLQVLARLVGVVDRLNSAEVQRHSPRMVNDVVSNDTINLAFLTSLGAPGPPEASRRNLFFWPPLLPPSRACKLAVSRCRVRKRLHLELPFSNR